MVEQAEVRISQFTPDENWSWPGGGDSKAAFHLDISRQELERRFGISYSDPGGGWGDQPGTMKHAFVNIDGVPVRLIEYLVGENEYLNGITEIDLDPGSSVTEQDLIDVFQLTQEQVIWRAED